MPVINIKEVEPIAFASFDATENAVFVPEIYIQSVVDITSEGVVYSDLPKSTMYTNSTTYKDDWKDHCPYLEYKYQVDNNNNKTVNKALLDRTFYMVYELLLQGMSVLVAPIGIKTPVDEDGNYQKEVVITEEQYEQILKNYLTYDPNAIHKEDEFVNSTIYFTELGDKNLYNVKFLTTGGYANINDDKLSEFLVDMAEKRGDAVALLEIPKEYSNNTITKYKLKDFVNPALGENSQKYKYAAITYPWCTFTTVLNYDVDTVQYKTLPASFAYLMSYANSVKTNANWFASAGTIRGLVPKLIVPTVNIGEAFMHYLQNDEAVEDKKENRLNYNINPVYNAGAYGYRIWGNRVAWKKTDTENNQYLEYLNVRILMCDIKKQIFHAAMRTTFEPNDDIVWYNFKSLANTLLDRMKSGRGIKWYKWFKEETDRKALIKATLTIQPIEAVESFEITISMVDSDIIVEEA